MDDFPRDHVQMTETCPRCGAPRAGPGRFCAQCGAEVFTIPESAVADPAGQHAARPQPTARRTSPQEVLIPEAWPEFQASPRSRGWRAALALAGLAIVVAAGVLFATHSGARNSPAPGPQRSATVLPSTDSTRPSAVAAPASADSAQGQAAEPNPPPVMAAAPPRAPKSAPAEEPRAPRKVPTRVAPEPHVPPATPVVLTCQSAYAQRSWTRAASLCADDAERGDMNAARFLATMYDQGLGVSRDAAQAAAWYRRAALLGDAGAQLALGRAYERGVGVPRDYGEAFAWLAKAAEQGNAQAQYDVGIMYAAGRGTPQSDTDAVRWLKKAAAQGQRDAARELERRGLTP
jgi:hypothetical protein